MRLAACLLFVSAACGRLEFEELGDASANGDTSVIPEHFNTPILITEVSNPLTDDDPTITGDGLELYFASERGGAATGYADIYMAKRVTSFSSWSAPIPVGELNSTDEDQSPGITADGLTIYFSSRRPTAMITGTSANTWVATRPDRSSSWSAPVLVLEVSSTSDEFEPQPDAANTRLVFYRQLSSTDRDLFMASRESPAVAWGAPAPIVEANTPGFERSPFLTADGSTLWFSSDRVSGAAGVTDIFVATRPGGTEVFGTPMAQAELNTAADDDDPSLSSDGRIMVFTSNATGNYEIYEARR